MDLARTCFCRRMSSASALSRASSSSFSRRCPSLLCCSWARARASSSRRRLASSSLARRSPLAILKVQIHPHTRDAFQSRWKRAGATNTFYFFLAPPAPSDLSFSSRSRRSSSSRSRRSRACRRFSARMRAASSGSLVPAVGLGDGAEGTTSLTDGSGDGEAEVLRVDANELLTAGEPATETNGCPTSPVQFSNSTRKGGGHTVKQIQRTGPRMEDSANHPVDFKNSTSRNRGQGPRRDCIGPPKVQRRWPESLS